MMLGSFARRAILRTVSSTPRRPNALFGSALQFYSGSHSDFTKQMKVEPQTSDSVEDFIRDTIQSNRVTLFMKGTPEYPQCGFSQQVIVYTLSSQCTV